MSILSSLFSRFHAMAGEGAPYAANSDDHAYERDLNQRYYDVLCNLSAAFDKFPSLQMDIPGLVNHFGTQMTDQKIDDFLCNDGLFETWIGASPLTRIASIAHGAQSIADKNRALLGDRYDKIDYEYAYIIEKILIAARRLPDMVDHPRNAWYFVEEEIGRIATQMNMPAKQTKLPRGFKRAL